MAEYTLTEAEVRECFQASAEGLDFKREYYERGEAFDRWLAAHDAELRAEVERLRAGIEALATEGEAWGRGVAVELSKRLRALLAESGEQPGEFPECGDVTCWCSIDWSAPVSPDSADVRERAIEAGVKAVKASPHGRWLVMPGPVSIQRQVATLIADAVLAVVGQGVTADDVPEQIARYVEATATDLSPSGYRAGIATAVRLIRRWRPEYTADRIEKEDA